MLISLEKARKWYADLDVASFIKEMYETQRSVHRVRGTRVPEVELVYHIHDAARQRKGLINGHDMYSLLVCLSFKTKGF